MTQHNIFDCTNIVHHPWSLNLSIISVLTEKYAIMTENDDFYLSKDCV